VAGRLRGRAGPRPRTLESRRLDRYADRIEHVGSTAVDGLPAKDIVDLDVVLCDRAVPEISAAIAAKLGGSRFENSDEWQPVFREHDRQRFNDHVFAVFAGGWKASVVTRDVLRARADLCREYEAL
jgi:GrpB-like predicted nucleotidyltransferase (UPF0157 family)